jgi:hypothetical protein
VVLQLMEQTAGNFTFETGMGADVDASGRSQLVYIRNERKKPAQNGL